MKKKYTHIFETSDDALNHLHFIARIVSSMTISQKCLVGFERHIPLVKISLLSLKLGIIDSLTFGFRVQGFDYGSSISYDYSYRKDKGDIVISVAATYKDGCFYITLF